MGLLKTQALFLMLVYLFLPVSAMGVKPTVPLIVDIKLGGVPELGTEFPVLLKIRSMMDAPMVKVRCDLPKGIEMLSGSDTWEGELEAGTAKEIILMVKVKNAGKHMIKATATIEYPGGAKMSRRAVLLIDLEKEDKAKSKPEKEVPPFRLRKGKEGQDIGEFPLE